MTYRSNHPADLGAADLLARLRKVLMWAGGIMLALGVVALLVPVVTSLVVGFVIGWFLFLAGAVGVAGAFSFRGTGLFAWQLLGGLLPLVAGALLIVFPEQGVIALTLLVALAFLATGVAQLSFALWARPPGLGLGRGLGSGQHRAGRLHRGLPARSLGGDAGPSSGRGLREYRPGHAADRLGRAHGPRF